MVDRLLIVESPSKAKTLKKYLGGDYEILATYGHVRDLVPKTGAVDPDNHFAMKYELIERNAKHVDAIAKAAKKADEILLATDPDREGEAIAWHIAEILKGKKILDGKSVKRVVFYEITQSAVKEAVAQPREIATELVNAQQARRALDYLVGFNLSPLLWKKISPGLSAGRVQSPALRMIVERELQIEAFQTREYWTLHLDSHKDKTSFSARLIQYRGEKIEQFSISNEAAHQDIVDTLARNKTGTVGKVEKKRRQRHPAAPFTTSTLQQEAVRKLGLSADRTMRTAQQLYEGIDIGQGSVGLITYMRTDSVNLAREAVAEIRSYIQKNFAPPYLPKASLAYKSKTKNAQEAHEAIRPTSIFRTPDSLKAHLSHDQLRLYEIIWKRALACQMSQAEFDTVSLDIQVGEPGNLFRATGQTLMFPGFIAVYQENRDDEEEEGESKLPPLAEGENIVIDKLYGEQHFTQPPPRYTEATLVKTLEEYGIGRPSTYASIISTLLDREYAVLDKKRFMPTPIGRLVTCFLTQHFTHYVDYDFTANLEDRLDDISNGKRKYLPLLSDFWEAFSDTLTAKQGVERGCPIPDETCPKCGKSLLLQNSRKGLFIGCSGYPDCDYTRPLNPQANEEPLPPLGNDPETGQPIYLLNGRYGWYVQIGETPKDSKIKPRRASLPKGAAPENATLELALKLLSLPRELGNHPETGKAVTASIGRFGPYIAHDGKFKSIPKGDDVYAIDLNRALEMLAMESAPRGGKSGGSGKQLGMHPEDGKPVSLMNGRYGWYVKHGATNATLPKDADPEAITLEEALGLLKAKLEKGSAAKRKPGKPGKKAA
jgi:DNA topoisomerase I